MRTDNDPPEWASDEAYKETKQWLENNAMPQKPSGLKEAIGQWRAEGQSVAMEKYPRRAYAGPAFAPDVVNKVDDVLNDYGWWAEGEATFPDYSNPVCEIIYAVLAAIGLDPQSMTPERLPLQEQTHNESGGPLR